MAIEILKYYWSYFVESGLWSNGRSWVKKEAREEKSRISMSRGDGEPQISTISAISTYLREPPTQKRLKKSKRRKKVFVTLMVNLK